MKKIDWKKIFAYVIFIVAIFVPLFIIYYIEENYELTKYLWTFNIIVVCILPFYYFIYNIKEKIKTRKLERSTIINKIDFKYYRDILEEYSPAMLSFILDGTEFDKDLSASIIYLINKGYLELKDDYTIKKVEKDCSQLSKDLQIIYNSDVNKLLAFRKIRTKSNDEKLQAHIASETMIEWMEQIEKQTVKAGLVIERKKYKITSILSILCILEVIYTLCFKFYGLFFFSCFLVLLLLLLKFWAYDKNKWVKTQKGYEVYKKIIGLKNYIKDYSLLSERELKEIAVWEDFLIYAIIFNNISKLNKEAMELYKKICNLKEIQKY